MRGYSYPGSKTAHNELQFWHARCSLPSHTDLCLLPVLPLVYKANSLEVITHWRLLQEPLCWSGSLSLFVVLANVTMR